MHTDPLTARQRQRQLAPPPHQIRPAAASNLKFPRLACERPPPITRGQRKRASRIFLSDSVRPGPPFPPTRRPPPPRPPPSTSTPARPRLRATASEGPQPRSCPSTDRAVLTFCATPLPAPTSSLPLPRRPGTPSGATRLPPARLPLPAPVPVPAPRRQHRLSLHPSSRPLPRLPSLPSENSPHRRPRDLAPRTCATSAAASTSVLTTSRATSAPTKTRGPTSARAVQNASTAPTCSPATRRPTTAMAASQGGPSSAGATARPRRARTAPRLRPSARTRNRAVGAGTGIWCARGGFGGRIPRVRCRHPSPPPHPL